jgi:hypothetical protein
MLVEGGRVERRAGSPRLRRFLLRGLVALAPTAVGCSALLDIGDLPPLVGTMGADSGSGTALDGAGGGNDATTSTTDGALADGATPDGGVDGSKVDGGTEAGTGSYSTLATLTNWSTFDVTTIAANATGFNVDAFDGRYMWFGSAGSRFLAQYDTQAAFSAAGSWTATDLSLVSGELFGFNSAAFDGRYVYLSNTHYQTARYDTQASPSALGSWDFFNGTDGRAGLAFDGRYVYVAPNYSGVFLSDVRRYDTTKTFNDGMSWSTFDTTNTDANAKGFWGTAFDGRYLYLAPTLNGIVPRYDTQAVFTSVTAWSAFDLGTVDAKATGFFGAVFDGRYVYFVPHGRGNATHVGRYDTTAAFGSATSWAGFDPTTVSANAVGFRGGVFDGRYVYFVPDVDQGEGHNGQYLLRYDTTADFATAGSWEVFDTTTVDAASRNFCMGGFDGAYVYLSPCSSGLITRFAARTPRAVPALPPNLAKGIASFL